MASKSWTLEQGVAFARNVDGFVRAAGFGMALAGSVLLIGKSTKDLDLIVFPLSSDRCDLEALHTALHASGLRPVLSAAKVREKWVAKGSTDTKHVETWRFGVRRVDIFLLK